MLPWLYVFYDRIFTVSYKSLIYKFYYQKTLLIQVNPGSHIKYSKLQKNDI